MAKKGKKISKKYQERKHQMKSFNAGCESNRNKLRSWEE